MLAQVSYEKHLILERIHDCNTVVLKCYSLFQEVCASLCHTGARSMQANG